MSKFLIAVASIFIVFSCETQNRLAVKNNHDLFCKAMTLAIDSCCNYKKPVNIYYKTFVDEDNGSIYGKINAQYCTLLSDYSSFNICRTEQKEDTLDMIKSYENKVNNIRIASKWIEEIKNKINTEIRIDKLNINKVKYKLISFSDLEKCNGTIYFISPLFYDNILKCQKMWIGCGETIGNCTHLSSQFEVLLTLDGSKIINLQWIDYEYSAVNCHSCHTDYDFIKNIPNKLKSSGRRLCFK